MAENVEASQEEIYSFVQNTLVESFMKLARVNIMTGEYSFLKKADALHDADYDHIQNIYEYIGRQVTDKLVLSAYAVDYMRFSDPEYVQKRVFSGERRIIQSYKRRSVNGDIWLTFAIIVPEGCSPEHPWTLFAWREADPDTTTMVDAIATLSAMYCKILKINLTTGAFLTVKLDENEPSPDRYSSISQWFRSFAEMGNVFTYDKEIYFQFTDIENLRSHFRQSRNKLSCRYRRKRGDGFHWAQMDLTPSIEYTDQNQVLILYVKDIHDEYMREMNNLQELENSYSRDALTLLYNRHKFNEDVEALSRSVCRLVTCLYADVNGLHEVNNLLGHKKGDDMLCCVADAMRKYFPDERVYRIGGDEFVMLSKTLTKPAAEEAAEAMKKELEKSHYAVSVGIESSESGSSVSEIIGKAELAMRLDKEEFYKRSDDLRLNRARNEELEKLLAQMQDADTFLKAISRNFAGVYFVNLKQDTLRHIYMPDHFGRQLEKSDFRYSEALKKYVDMSVDPAYAEEFRRVLDYGELTKRLSVSGTVEFSYRKTDGSLMRLKIMSLSQSTGVSDETLWIFSCEKQPV